MKEANKLITETERIWQKLEQGRRAKAANGGYAVMALLLLVKKLLMEN